jgi:membrane protease YdiL (CAAX protease family)
LRWYVFALLPALLLSCFLALLSLAGWRGPLAYGPTVGGVLLGVIISIAEEIGWRGFALPRLQRRWGAFTASIVIGLLWYLWHLPMFFGQGVPSNLWLVMVLYFCGASLLLTAVYNAARGGLVLPVIAHLAAHLNNSHRALPLEQLPLVAHAIIYAALGLWLMRRQASRPGTPWASRGRPLRSRQLSW